MKNKDLIIFLIILVFAFFIGLYLFDKQYESYSDIITFLSIMIGFKITSLSILFNSPLKKTLYDRKNKDYKTELHRLKDFYKHSLYFEVLSVAILFLPEKIDELYFLEKHVFILPIIAGTIYCFYKITSELLAIFVYPTNEKT